MQAANALARAEWALVGAQIYQWARAAVVPPGANASSGWWDERIADCVADAFAAYCAARAAERPADPAAMIRGYINGAALTARKRHARIRERPTGDDQATIEARTETVPQEADWRWLPADLRETADAISRTDSVRDAAAMLGVGVATVQRRKTAIRAAIIGELV